MNARTLAMMSLAVILAASVVWAAGVGGGGGGAMPPVRPGPVGQPRSGPIPGVNPNPVTNQPTGRPAPGATPTPKPQEFAAVYDFVSFTNNTLTVKLLNSTSTKTFANMPPAIAGALGKATPDDMISLHGTYSSKGTEITSAALYTPKLGEDDPHAYVFENMSQQTIGKDNFTIVNVKKYFQAFTFQVPNVKGADNKPAPLPAMMDNISAFKPGDLLEIEADSSLKPPRLRSIQPYGDVKRMRFSAIVHGSDASQPASAPASRPSDAAGLKAIADDDATSTFTIDPASKTAHVVAGKLSTFKAGQYILIRMKTADDGGTVLADVRLSPRQTPPPSSAPASQPSE